MTILFSSPLLASLLDFIVYCLTAQDRSSRLQQFREDATPCHIFLAKMLMVADQASTWVRVGKIVMETGLISPWKLGLAACCLIALVYAALFVSQIEKRYPLVSYKIADQVRTCRV